VFEDRYGEQVTADIFDTEPLELIFDVFGGGRISGCPGAAIFECS